MSKITVNFAFETETKNKFRFAEVDAKGEPLEQKDAVVGTLYVSKTALGGNAPKTLSIEIEGGTDGKGKKGKGASVETGAAA